MSGLIIPKNFSDCHSPDFRAVKLVGLLLLERCPKSVIFSDDRLRQEYPAALQEFIDFMHIQYGIDYLPHPDLEQRVMDDIMSYLERKGAML